MGPKASAPATREATAMRSLHTTPRELALLDATRETLRVATQTQYSQKKKSIFFDIATIMYTPNYTQIAKQFQMTNGLYSKTNLL